MAIYVVTGIQAAGKSTVAQALAERLEKSVHLRGDLFRRMVVNGRADMGPADPPAEALRQLRLRYALAAAAADGYAEAGFDVVYQDIILGPDHRPSAQDDPHPSAAPGRPGTERGGRRPPRRPAPRRPRQGRLQAGRRRYRRARFLPV
jgi:hypothetical protein